ncbi:MULTISPECIES: PAS domain S-box protein [unclassified Rhodococcus (in: high G+C Gram-positive bacteria)]|uniref:PAS domain S-box protein n=1 Tax=unclassified Rhodococcus (in: high G+C Gram-positive bacteria) TaxID=192944 RepID=UPI00096A3534|nr:MULTISPECIES: PAS domain S-box protein [unclassified Rhodococcus (in: high G+C Gram-positive bacteria)]
MALETGMGILIHEASSKNILWANPAACRMFGFTLEELKPLKAHHMSAQERQYRRELGVAWLQSAVVHGTSRKQWKYRTKDGVDFLTDCRATLVHFEDCPVVMVEFRNIDEEVELQEELTWVSESLQRIMTHTAAGIVVLDDDNCIEDISSMAAGLFGRTPAQLSGMHLEDVGRCEPRLTSEQVVERLGNTSVSIQLEVRKSDGIMTWLAGELEIVAHDGIRSRVLTVRDVTERVEWERKHAYQEANLQYLSRYNAMGDMAMILAHELGQPLAASTNYLSGLKTRVAAETIDARSLTYGIAQIEQQLHRAAEIVTSVKRYVQRIESTAVLMDLNETVEESLYFVRLRAAERGVRVYAEIPERSFHIHGESVLIGQVVINLCVNALHEIVRPTTEVKELAVTTGESDGNAYVCIRDQGRGMEGPITDRLASGAFSAKQDGAGIGLIISEHIVERHGGFIEYLPNDPTGTIAKLVLPLAERAPAGERPAS